MASIVQETTDPLGGVNAGIDNHLMVNVDINGLSYIYWSYPRTAATNSFYRVLSLNHR
jgi:hypothetical protein